jgi:hypothetical protein
VNISGRWNIPMRSCDAHSTNPHFRKHTGCCNQSSALRFSHSDVAEKIEQCFTKEILNSGNKYRDGQKALMKYEIVIIIKA